MIERRTFLAAAGALTAVRATARTADLVPITVGIPPGYMGAIVDYALAHGWDPAAVGGRYELSPDAGLAVIGFRVAYRR